MGLETAANGVPALGSKGLADREGEPVTATVAALAEAKTAVDLAMIDAAARAWSSNTKRAFLADLNLWNAWCSTNGVRPLDADAKLVAEWVRALGGLETERRLRTPIKKRAPATIARYLVHVGMAYRMAGLTDPTSAPPHAPSPPHPPATPLNATALPSSSARPTALGGIRTPLPHFRRGHRSLPRRRRSWRSPRP